MNFLKTTALTTALLLSTAAFAETGVTDTEIKLGADSVQSGPMAFYGLLQRVVKAYFEMINEQGGINGRKVNYIIRDNADSTQQALQMAKKLVEEDKVFAMVGSGPNHHAAIHYLQENKIPDLWILDVYPNYTVPTNKTTFAFSPSLTDEAEWIANYILKTHPGKKLGLLVGNNQGGHFILDAFKKTIGDKAKLVIEETDLRAEPIAKSQILNFKKEGVEVVYTGVPLPGLPATMNFAQEQGFKPQWYLAYYNTHAAVLKLAKPEAIEGAVSSYYTYTDQDADIPAVKKHLEFMAKYLPNEKVSTVTLGAQAAAELAVETLKRAGKDLTRESVLKAAESIKDWQCTVCRAPASAGPDKHRFITEKALLVAKGGKWVALEADKPKKADKKDKKKKKS